MPAAGSVWPRGHTHLPAARAIINDSARLDQGGRVCTGASCEHTRSTITHIIVFEIRSIQAPIATTQLKHKRWRRGLQMRHRESVTLDSVQPIDRAPKRDASGTALCSTGRPQEALQPHDESCTQWAQHHGTQPVPAHDILMSRRLRLALAVVRLGCAHAVTYQPRPSRRRKIAFTTRPAALLYRYKRLALVHGPTAGKQSDRSSGNALE